MAAVTEALGASLAALATAGASRQVVSAALAAGLRVIAHLSGVASEPDSELDARLTALRVVLSAQQAAAKDGHPQHSAKGLVSPDELLMANAARHQFSECFERATPASARRSQRGRRKPRGTAPACAPQSSSSEAEPRLAELLRHLELRVRRLEERAAPDALGVWFADASAGPSHNHADGHNHHHHDDHPDQESPEVRAPRSTAGPEDADTAVAVLFPDLAASAAAAPAALEEAPSAAPAIDEAPTAPAPATDEAPTNDGEETDVPEPEEDDNGDDGGSDVASLAPTAAAPSHVFQKFLGRSGAAACAYFRNAISVAQAMSPSTASPLAAQIDAACEHVPKHRPLTQLDVDATYAALRALLKRR